MTREFALGTTTVLGINLSDEMLRLVMKTWEGIPATDREIINRYWNFDGHRACFLATPIITMTAGMVDGRGRASTDVNGFVIRLSAVLNNYNQNAAALDRPLDVDAMNVIAHEFGHVFDRAKGAVDPVIAQERFANQTLLDWGFQIPDQTDEVYKPKVRKTPWLD